MLHTEKTKDYLEQALILYTVHRKSKQVYLAGRLTPHMKAEFDRHGVCLDHVPDWTKPEGTYDTIIWYDLSRFHSDDRLAEMVNEARQHLAEGGNLIILDNNIKSLEDQPAWIESVPSGEHLYLLANHLTWENLGDTVVYVKMALDLTKTFVHEMMEPSPLQESDAKAVAECLFDAYRAALPDDEQTPEQALENVCSALKDPKQPWIPEASYLLKDHLGVQGAIIITRFEGLPLVNQLVVRPDNWGRGIGENLLQSAMKRLIDRGETTLQLYVLLDNVPAKRLYENMGFIETGRGMA